MSDIAIRVEHLGKQYRIGGLRSRQTFREAIMEGIKAPFRKTANLLRGQAYGASDLKEVIWALKDTSFEIRQGEAVGIIGRNGAGKSTLLKILSRITEPTEGAVDLYGRVGSLLEVGTGFHTELTGRENIYLNGAILGMKKNEIEQKYDEIVEFAEIEQFLDTPVKHYSSGMYIRLAFAVAAHLQPEILLVDEVLAVGDAAFQKKCMGKMSDVARQGRTVLFVSHNMSAIASLCDRGIVLEKGSVAYDGAVPKAISRYLSDSQLTGIYIKPDRKKYQKFSIDKACLLKDNHIDTSFYNSETLLLRIETSVKERIKGIQVAFELLTEMEECIFSSSSQDQTLLKEVFQPGAVTFECPLDLAMFRPGVYRIKLSASIPNVEILEIVDQPLVFEVFDDSSPVLKLGQNRRGIILPRLNWKIIPEGVN